MPEVTIREFKLKDIWSLEPEGHDESLIGHPVIMEGLYNNSIMQTAVTVECEGKIIACAGVSIVFDHRGEVWGIFSKEAKNIRFTLLRETKRWIEHCIERFELRRIEATARVDWPEAVNFLRHLGFEMEGKKIKFEQDGTDAYSFARVE